MTRDTEHVETVIIGGGHAGLTMSYSLSRLGREHVILERGRVGERWRSERWDSFHFQFPNWTIELPGYNYQCDDSDAFAPGSEVVRFLDGYADFIHAPVRCGTTVTSLEQEDQPEKRMSEAKEVSDPVLELDLESAGITSIVWATGFRYDFDWVKLPVFDDLGEPVHQRGITNFPGIYFLGLRWLHKRKSSFLLKAAPAEDADYLTQHINNRGNI